MKNKKVQILEFCFIWPLSIEFMCEEIEEISQHTIRSSQLKLKHH